MDNVYSLDSARKNKELEKVNDAIVTDARQILADSNVIYLGFEDRITRAKQKVLEKLTKDAREDDYRDWSEASLENKDFRITITLEPPESFWQKENYGRVSAIINFDTIEEASEAYRELIKDDDCTEGLKLEDIFKMQRNFLDRQ